MPKPRASKVLEALEREMLSELGSGELYDGWVIATRIGAERPRTLPWSFSYHKVEVYDVLLRYGLEANRLGFSWAAGFPTGASRGSRLRWLRRRG